MAPQQPLEVGDGLVGDLARCRNYPHRRALPLPPIHLGPRPRFRLGSSPPRFGVPESGRRIERGRIGAVLAHDAAQHGGGVGFDLARLALRFDHVEHLLRHLVRQRFNLRGDVLALRSRQFRRVDQFCRRFGESVAALVRGRHRLNRFPAGRLFLGRFQRRYPVVAGRVLVFVLNTTTTTRRFGFRRAFRGGGGVWGGGGSLCVVSV